MSWLLIFRAVAEPRISTKSAKFREIHQNTRNPAKSARNLTKYMSAQYIWKLSWLLGLLTCCKRANLPWNFVTAARKQLPKTYQAFLDWCCEKLGSNDVKTQAFLAKTVETGDESATACLIVCSLFVKNAASCEGLRLIRSSHLQRWRSSVSERLIRSTNNNAWKPAKWAKFLLVLTR